MANVLLPVVFYFYYLLAVIVRQFKRKKTRGKRSVLYLDSFFPGNAGYHWRVEKWADEMKVSGHEVRIQTAFSESEFRVLQNNFSLFLIRCMHRRFWQVVGSSMYDVVVVRRELLIYNDYGKCFLERLLLKIHPNAILDFDDDIAAAKAQPKKINTLFGRLMLEDGNKFNNTLTLYKNFIVASGYLKERIQEEKQGQISHINVMPTCVDYDTIPIKTYSSEDSIKTIGWIGGDHNYFLLDMIIPVLNKLSTLYDLRLLVIGGKSYTNISAKFVINFRKWSLDSEVENLKQIDIGIMPLNESMISKGKGGFKLIQYMALGIVSVASPVTINREIVNDGVDSFLADGEEEWEKVLNMLLSGSIDLNEIGRRARKKIAENYTFVSNRKKYIEFIEKVAAM